MDSNDADINNMFDGDDATGWSSQEQYGDGWMNIRIPEGNPIQEVIITRKTSALYKAVCLIPDGNVGDEVCTDNSGFGAPWLKQDDIHFPVYKSTFPQQEIII